MCAAACGGGAQVVSLFYKRTARNTSGYVPDWYGFSIPDKFVVGFCMDYNDAYR